MAQVLTAVEPESEKFALSPTADLDEIREFLRCESLERMQLCMRLQKQQELLEQLSEGFEPLSTPLKDVGTMDRNEDPRSLRMAGTCQKQLHMEVDALKRSVETLTQDVKELQESLDPVDGSRMEGTNSLVLSRNDGKAQDDSPRERLEGGPLDCSYKVAGSDAVEEFTEGVYENALDLQWLDERFEELQRQCLAELSDLEERLMEDFGNFKGFVDAAIVTMVSRMSTLEIFVKGEGGLVEKLEALKQEHSLSPQRCSDLEDQLKEVNERLSGLEKRVKGFSERPSSVTFSPAPTCRNIKPRGVETADSVTEKHPEALSPQRVLSHGPVLLPQSVNPPGSLKVPATAAWGSPVQPIFRVGASSSLVTVLATPRTSSPSREVRQVHPSPALHPSAGRSATPMRTFHGVPPVPVVRAPASPVAPVVRF